MTKIKGWWTLAVVNGLGAAVSMGFSVAGMIDPALVAPGSEVTSTIDLYAQAYGARALPLGAAILFLLATRSKGGLIPMLAVAGVVQAGDCLIGATRGTAGMALGGGTLAAVHLVSVWWLARHGRRAPAPATA
ncbi:hypothetical protein [Streptosporangium sp. NPDC000396]|uniref:hypothetical protein n=1 Tax=Streptosporangium sp. NPDC000396 TaxID=3366185 RepID=UPI0036835BDB